MNTAGHMYPDPSGPTRRACSTVAAASTSIPAPIRSTTAFAGVSASYKPIRFSGINVFRIVSGQVAEIWNHRDDLSLMQQIGAIPQR